MNDTSAPKRDVTVGEQTIQARLIRLNDKDVPIVKLGQIAEVKQGLATGDNDAYLFQNPAARGTYRSINEYSQFLLTDADLIRIQQDDELRLAVIQHGISKDDPHSARFFGGRYIVPYDKGGESDSEGGWLPNYYVPTNYFIDWSEWSLNRMRTYTIAQRIIDKSEPKPVLEHYKTQIAAAFRNPEFNFLNFIAYSRTGAYAPTFRINSAGCFDSKSNAVAASSIEIGLLNSLLFRYLFKCYSGHTVQAEGDAMLEIPTTPSSSTIIKNLVAQIITKQKANPRYDYASHEQIEIDRLVYEAYGLNEADIHEVETWYARRYPRLAEAQARNRVAVVKLTQTIP